MGLVEVEPSCLGVTAGGSGVGASRVAAHCGNRLLSEPTAAVQFRLADPRELWRTEVRVSQSQSCDVSKYGFSRTTRKSGEYRRIRGRTYCPGATVKASI